MPRKRREKSPSKFELKQPDRSGPTDETLLQFAQGQGLFDKAEQKQQSNRAKTPQPQGKPEDNGPPPDPAAERIMETVLWTISLAMLHFTFDVLVQHQYAVEIIWWPVVERAVMAFLVFGMLFYTLHPHSDAALVPGLSSGFQNAIRQTIFLLAGTSAGCYLIHITNRYNYLAVMKQAPPLGCIWIWSVIELNLPLALLSVGSAVLFLRQGGYDFK